MQVGSSLRITKREWQALGGLANPRLYRRMRSGSWRYFMVTG